MGWDFTPGLNDKNKFISDLIRSGKYGKIENKCLRYSLRGNHLWTIWEITDWETNEKRKIINLFLISHQRGDGWGYKGISESCGPFYYDCPITFFKTVPVPQNAHALEWREKVKQHHINSKKKKGYLITN